jgi:hypothetical protein
MTFYAMLAFNANTVDLGLPPELTEPPLPVKAAVNRHT